MLQFKYRLITELHELDEKIASIQEFAKSHASCSLLDEDPDGHSTFSPEEAQRRTEEYNGLLRHQLASMRDYRACLVARLRLLGIDFDPREPHIHF